jgi:hypothetical protein
MSRSEPPQVFTVNDMEDDSEQPVLVARLMEPLSAPGGTSIRRRFAFTILKPAGTPKKSTETTVEKLVPATSMESPGQPELGFSEAIVGYKAVETLTGVEVDEHPLKSVTIAWKP